MKMTPRTEDLPHGAERLNSLAAELAAVDEQCYRAAVEELYMDASGELAEKEAELADLRKDKERLTTALERADKAIVALIDSRGCQLPEVRLARTEIKAALAAAKGGKS